jgi:hypothetical protein
MCLNNVSYLFFDERRGVSFCVGATFVPPQFQHWLLNWCWSLPAWWFLVPSPTGLTPLFYGLLKCAHFPIIYWTRYIWVDNYRKNVGNLSVVQQFWHIRLLWFNHLQNCKTLRKYLLNIESVFHFSLQFLFRTSFLPINILQITLQMSLSKRPVFAASLWPELEWVHHS